MTDQILDPHGDDAATINMWSDRNPATIVKRTAKTIVVQEDRVQPLGGSYAEGTGKVNVYIRDESSPEQVYTLRSNGRWVRKGASKTERGASLTVGTRSYYRDPSF